MKQKILKTSAALVITATAISLGNTLFTSNPELLIRLTAVSYTLGLGSIGLFFVGLVYPKEVV